MAITALIGWWYGEGWLTLGRKISGRVQGVLRFFSVGMLAGSLFAPFRQISAGRVRGPLAVQMRAFADRLFSRVIGAIVRSLLIVIGLVVAVLSVLIGVIMMILWPLMPLAPFLALIVMSTGYTPL